MRVENMGSHRSIDNGNWFIHKDGCIMKRLDPDEILDSPPQFILDLRDTLLSGEKSKKEYKS